MRATGGSSKLQKLVGAAAYLVNNGGASDYTWTIKGRPVAPVNRWTSEGLNLVGFPTPVAAPPLFANFLAPSPVLQAAEIYHYPGGPLSVSNPQRLFTLATSPVKRGQAFWIRSGDAYNRYFGPFEVILQDHSGVNFGDSTAQYSIRLRNLTSTERTVTLTALASETAPAGEAATQGDIENRNVPLLLRGALDAADLTYAYASLNSTPGNWTLAPAGQVGSEVEIVLGVNRGVMSGPSGTLYAGVLRFTDSDGLSQVDAPVSATVPSNAGLWVGSAEITQVRSYLKSFQKDMKGALVVSTNEADFGSYVTTGLNTDFGPVPEPMNLRLIVHADSGGAARLMQRVYHGIRDDSNLVLATRQQYLDSDTLASARRVSAIHLPWSESNDGWAFAGGALQPGDTLTATVDLAYDDRASNPFIHAYHPDHDNLDAKFEKQLSADKESYKVSRQITVAPGAPGDDFNSLTRGGQILSGVYAETISLGASRTYEIAGSFVLRRLNRIATLTTE